jgi:2-C-methyl-D-erythritol 4-phosphate cytidylyltransferase/2-C-methyl-D-erythritol 2,4-cyclodiphosphate synthase
MRRLYDVGMVRNGEGLAVLVVAAGRSSRMGGTLPKIWMPFLGAPLLARSLAVLERLVELEAAVVVVRDEDRGRAAELVSTSFPGLAGRLGGRLRIVAGGAERRDSVRNGLAALAGAAVDVVLVHDAARPNASAELFRSVAAAARRTGAAVPVVPIVDTLRRRDAAGRPVTVARDGLHAIQTPQGFRRDLLERVHLQPVESAAITDDAMLFESLGMAVDWVAGESSNVKITHPGDLEPAERLAGGTRMPNRIGLGHDLHRLLPGGPLRLSGVDIEGDVHSEGHSDGDALLHAVTDALLGACALGDIGQHFSDLAPENRHRDSAEFLRHALELVRRRGYLPIQVDVVVRLERPRLAPFHPAMRARLAQLLGLPVDAVSIKAKSGEGVDAVGEGKAIACEAVLQVAPIRA